MHFHGYSVPERRQPSQSSLQKFSKIGAKNLQLANANFAGPYFQWRPDFARKSCISNDQDLTRPQCPWQDREVRIDHKGALPGKLLEGVTEGYHVENSHSWLPSAQFVASPLPSLPGKDSTKITGWIHPSGNCSITRNQDVFAGDKKIMKAVVRNSNVLQLQNQEEGLGLPRAKKLPSPPPPSLRPSLEALISCFEKKIKSNAPTPKSFFQSDLTGK